MGPDGVTGPGSHKQVILRRALMDDEHEMIDPKLASALGYYVYELLDPQEPARPFYVGEGVRERVLQHLRDASLTFRPEDLPEEEEEERGARIQRITAIRSEGREPEVRIVHYGLESKKAARALEASLIATYRRLGVDLTNQNAGYGADQVGLSLVTLRGELGAADAELTDPAVVVKCDFHHRAKPADVAAWDTDEALRLYNSERFWSVSKERRAELTSRARAGKPALLIAVTQKATCLGVWAVIDHDPETGVFETLPDARAERYWARRLLSHGRPASPQQGVRYFNLVGAVDE